MGETLRSIPVEIKLSETSDGSGVLAAPRKLQLFRTGNFKKKDPATGRKFSIPITSEMLKSMKHNFDEGVRGIDLAVDYKHDNEDVAAAWFKKLEMSEDGKALMAEVDWTPRGEKVVVEKEFRYISPEFDLNYEDNEEGKQHGPTLLGAGLTNRPVIKKMKPVVDLSEGKGNEEMELEKKVQELEVQLSEGKTKLSTLETENADLKKQVVEFQERDKKAADERKLAEKKSKFDTMLSEKKVVEAQREPFMSGDMEKFTELAQPLNVAAKGHGEGNGGNGGGYQLSEDEKKVCASLGLTEEEFKKHNNIG